MKGTKKQANRVSCVKLVRSRTLLSVATLLIHTPLVVRHCTVAYHTPAPPLPVSNSKKETHKGFILQVLTDTAQKSLNF